MAVIFVALTGPAEHPVSEKKVDVAPLYIRPLFLPPPVVCITIVLCMKFSEAGKPSKFCTRHPVADELAAPGCEYTTVSPFGAVPASASAPRCNVKFPPDVFHVVSEQSATTTGSPGLIRVSSNPAVPAAQFSVIVPLTCVPEQIYAWPEFVVLIPYGNGIVECASYRGPFPRS